MLKLMRYWRPQKTHGDTAASVDCLLTICSENNFILKTTILFLFKPCITCVFLLLPIIVIKISELLLQLIHTYDFLLAERFKLLVSSFCRIYAPQNNPRPYSQNSVKFLFKQTLVATKQAALFDKGLSTGTHLKKGIVMK